MSVLFSDAYRFDEFELVLTSRSLRRSGMPLNLSPKAFDVLTQLVINHGRVVTKEEILSSVWRGATVEEGNLSQHVSALRKALTDRASYIVTIPGRGYQFTAKVHPVELDEVAKKHLGRVSLTQPVYQRTENLAEPSLSSQETATVAVFPLDRRSSRSRIILSVAAILLAVSLCLVAVSLESRRHADKSLGVSSYFQVTTDGREKYLAGTDGSRIYFTQKSPQLAAQVAVSGGLVVPLAVPVSKAWLQSVSPDGSTILLTSEAGGMTSSKSLWSYGLLGSPLRHLGKAVASAWSPNGETIAYATEQGDLCLIASDQTRAQKLVSVGGYVHSLSWSPDGGVIRLLQDGRLWDIAPDGRGLHQVLNDWPEPSPISDGQFSSDGHYFFVAEGQIWVLPGKPTKSGPTPTPLTSGPLRWEGITLSKDAQKVFAVGTIRRGELVRSDPQAGRFSPVLAGISAEFVSFSRDGQYVAYVSYPEGILWRANRDGSNALQLTAPPVYPKLVRWSPDGTQILFSDKSPQGLSAMYIVPAAGGSVPRRLIPGDVQNETDPTWSPKGDRIAFSTSSDQYLDSHPVIRILDLASHLVTALQGSAGLYSPRWSPDGRYLVASTLDSMSMRYFDFTNQQWSQLSSGPVAFPEWSHDSRYIYYVSWGDDPAVLRVAIRGGRSERVADLAGEQYTGFYSVWMGLDPADSPLMLRDRGSHDIYALTLNR